MILRDILTVFHDSEELVIETANARVFRGFRDGEISLKHLNMEVSLILSMGASLIKIIIK